MTFDEFKADFFVFLENSTVNMGRKTSKTRQTFINTAIAKFDAFASKSYEKIDEDNKKSVPNPMNSSVLCIKPSNRKKALDVGKGVHAMTPSESMRADEQLNRSPFSGRSGKTGKEGKENV